MATTSVQSGVLPAPKGLVARVIGIITSPGDTFRSVVAHPKWLGMLVLTTLTIAVLATAPFMTEAGKEAALEQQVRQTEAMRGQPVTDQQYEAMRSFSAVMPYFTAGSVLIMGPVMSLIFSGILFAIFNAMMGGNATFKQIFAVVVHAGVISMLGQVFAAPVNYMRGTTGSVANLGVMLPMIEETSFAGRLLGMVDVFIIWWVIVLAIGLAVLYRRKTPSIAMILFSIYAVIALGVAAVMSR
jgi:hypothetical protein